MRQAKIYRKEMLAGMLTEDGGNYTFIYDSAYLASPCVDPVALEPFLPESGVIRPENECRHIASLLPLRRGLEPPMPASSSLHAGAAWNLLLASSSLHAPCFLVYNRNVFVRLKKDCGLDN